jgi:tRNA uridine 5-carbamoylmethylation protein Kti12
MYKVVLTGGPSSGKSTICKQLKAIYSNKIQVCPEAAEMIFRGGFPRLEDSVGLAERQYAIFHVQKALTNLSSVLNPNAEILLFDRGLLDGLCYWPGSWNSFEDKMRINIESTRKDYQLVIQLGVAHQEDYQNTAFRPEDQQTSLDMEQKLKQIWEEHPNYHFLPYTLNLEDKSAHCLELINTFKSN